MKHYPNAKALITLALMAVGLAAAEERPPAAPVRPVVERFFGTEVVDPYRWLENLKDPEVFSWMKAQDRYARQKLDALPDRAAFAERLQALSAAGADDVARVQRSIDGRLFYLHRGPGDDQYRLMVRAADGGAQRLLFDPMAAVGKGDPPRAITYFRPSPRGTRVGIVVSSAGSEAGFLHVIDVASREPLIEPIDRADWALPGWIDEDRFLIQRLQALAPGQSTLDKYRNVGLELIQLADAKGVARQTVLPTRAWKEFELDVDSNAVVRPLPDERTALGIAYRGVQNELALFIGDWSAAASPEARWQRVVGYADGIVDFTVHGRTLYVISHRDAPRRRVLAYSLDTPTEPPREVLAASQQVVLRILAASDALYVLVRDGNVQQLLQIPHRAGAKPTQVVLPLAGQIYLDAGWGRDLLSSRQQGLVIGLQGWSRALQFYAVQSDGAVAPLDLPRLAAIDAPTDLASTELVVTSHDGAKVPMSLLHRKDVKLDGRNPVWLQAYASYGFSIDPHFRRANLAWLERGGVLAFANPRGSGVYGQDWYLAGKGSTKPNTWLDVIACAEHLIKSGWTQPQRLGFSGRSAGGMLAGRVLTARPDLFGAVVPQVGALDMLRMEFSPNGPPNIPEFGSVRTEAGFRALQAMSPYEHVRKGAAYPAVLLTHGLNDPRVEAWASTKMAARLQAASSSLAPILLSLQFDAGHGVGNTKAQQEAEAADVMAFLWWRLAEPK